MLSLLTLVTVVIFGAVGGRQTGSLLRIDPHSRNHAESRHFQQPQLHRFGAVTNASSSPAEKGFEVPSHETCGVNTARARDPPEKGHFGRGGQHNLLGSYNHRYSGY